MQSATSFERERKEVESLLASGIFHRAPNLAHVLEYICRKYFDGTADEIKEYNIAVEALGRPPEFDQKRDSIVRVEAHRLRKRLREYYEREGAIHEIRIEIPSGQYTPRFVEAGIADPVPGARTVDEREKLPAIRDDGEHSTLLVPVFPVPATLDNLQPPVPGSRAAVRWIWTLVIVALGLTAGFVVFVDRERAARPVHSPDAVAMPDPSGDIRILAGVTGGGYVDAFERSWQADRYFSGGYVTQTSKMRPVFGTRDLRLYQSRREGSFKYDIPLSPGSYELKLYFAETVFGDNNVAGGGETSRIFNVSANGQPLLTSFDVINDAGSAVADIKVFKDISPAADGKLHLDFAPMTNPGFVNAIEVLRGVPGKILPVRIVARDRGIKDSQNFYWDPDRYAQGGQIVARNEATVTGAEPELYRSERFGNLGYTIPVAQPGRYGITMYFAENWFGPGNPGGGGLGSRVFDILINGVVVRRNFDIFKEAGGPSRAATVTLHSVEANHQGKIVIALTPARNYACINALQIVDESK
ncbi:MAG: malectin [Acidobacteriota bacterium]|nr:malectin [Acidobacteriota bacterium]